MKYVIRKEKEFAYWFIYDFWSKKKDDSFYYK